MSELLEHDVDAQEDDKHQAQENTAPTLKEVETADVDSIALVNGEVFSELPQDLYIPPDALLVFLEAFEGPLDLLLYLIKKQNLDILDIPIARITRQYMDYVEMMKALQLELAAEYLVMAAMLAEIKSRMLLPRQEVLEEEEDPRAELIRRLQEYEQFKRAAEDIDALPRLERDITPVDVKSPEFNLVRQDPDVDMQELLLAIRDVFRRAELFTSHNIQRETLSVREKMSKILSIVTPHRFIDFIRLFDVEEGRMGVVVTFLSVMELVKESMIEIVQTKALGPIHVRALSSEQES
ncbi:MAG: ScpA family protein [Pseudomonadota bacterium]